MSKKRIILLSIIIVILIISGVGYFSKKKYDSLLKSTSEGIALGKVYGQTISQSNCMFGLKMKYSSCSTTECELSANGYISACMENAEIDDFCNNVPSIKNTDKASAWADETCSKNLMDSKKCTKFIHKFVKVCTEQNESRAISKAELFKTGFEKGVKKAIK